MRSISAFQPKRSDARVAPVVMVLETVDGQLVTIEINNNAAYGYDVRAELVGEQGTVAMNNVAYTRINSEAVPAARATTPTGGPATPKPTVGRTATSYVSSTPASFPTTASNCWDGYCAAIVAEAGVKALHEGRSVPVEMIAKPEFYA